MEVFNKKAGNDHPDPVMHKPCSIHFSHPCVDDRKPCDSLAPLCKDLFIIAPFNFIEYMVERSEKYLREIEYYRGKKIAPV